MEISYYDEMRQNNASSIYTWSFLLSATDGQRANRIAESLDSVARQSNSDMKEEIEGNPASWTTGPPCAQGTFHVYV